MILALWGREKLAEDRAVADSGGWGGITLAYNVSSPTEVDALLAAAAAAGATIARPGGRTFWGGYSGIFVDLDGHPWEVAHNPRVDPGGRRQRAPARVGTGDSTDQPTAWAGVTFLTAGWRGRRPSHCSPACGSVVAGSQSAARSRPERLAT